MTGWRSSVGGYVERVEGSAWGPLAATVSIAYALTRVLELGSADFVDAMLDTRPAILVTSFGLVTLVLSCVLVVLGLTDTPVSDRVRELGKATPATLASLGAVSILALGTDSQSADSSVLVSTTSFLRDGNLRWLLESQEAPLPHAVYGPLVGADLSFDRFVIVPVIGTVALLCWIGREVIRRTDSAFLGVVAVLAAASAPTILRQANRLTFYPWFALLGTYGILTLVRWVGGRAPLWKLVLACLAISAAVASHGAGLYFAVAAAGTVVLIESRHDLQKWLIGMVMLGLTSMPWLVSHYWVRGLTRFFTPRDAWILNEGYLLQINEFFWGHSVETRLSALLGHPSVYFSAAGWLGLPLLALAFYGLRNFSRRQQLFVVLCGCLLVGPLAITRSAGFPRYFYLALPGIVVLASVGLGRIVPRASFRSWSGATIGFGLLLSAVWSSFLPLMESHLADRPRRAEIAAARAFLQPGDGVLGYRSMMMNIADPSARTFHQDLAEEEVYRALYAWRTDELRLFAEDSGVEWILLAKPLERWESDYNNSWFVEAYGFSTAYVLVLERANCKVYDGEFLALYQLDRCYSP